MVRRVLEIDDSFRRVNALQGCDLCEVVHNTAVHTPSGSIEICTNAVVSGLDEFTKR